MIRVMGGGAFGTALAISLAGNGPVTLWARDEDHVAEMRETGTNARRLPDVALPKAITVTADPNQGSDAKETLLVVPTQKLRGFLEAYAGGLGAGPFVACCKGVELSSGLRPTQIIAEFLPNADAAILTGPSFAADIARGLPTALTLACADDAVGRVLQRRLTTPNLRMYRTTDVIGAELGGALKNVMAIACGAAMGAGLGESARAALITRGYAEMSRFAASLGAVHDTMTGLSGFGDLVLTCTSDQSRNYRFGLSLGRKEAFDRAVTVEGAATAQAVHAQAEAKGIDLPITAAVTALIAGQLQVTQAMDMLLSRPLKEE